MGSASIDPTGSAPEAPAETASAPGSGVKGFPVPHWDRYELIGFLGAGGMGRVFKARDRRLNRVVALKLIRGDDPQMVQRFFREARAQARAVHPNICQIHEVGEVEGHPFIAMEYLDGSSLKQAKGEMTREQKVQVVKGVALGLHEAHRLGLIHGDIKPANIMIDRDEAGAYRPHIVDFGLAREVDVEGQTRSGLLAGTPAYMSPEQAQGEIHRLDRRADVYALGATLYEILGGRLPFTGSNPVQILFTMLTEEPAPLRSLDPDVPADLETIVMKCLEKEPHRRYDSARALADDLQRYLDGDPILGRRGTFAYRLRKKAGKHKALVSLASAALLAVLILGGVALRAQWTAAAQAELAQELGQDVKEMELFLRYAHALPLHDGRQEEAVVLSRMREIEARMAQIGRAAEGPGRYALGRGYLGLRRYAEAEAHLAAAWARGYRAPEVAYALGLSQGELYRQVLDEAQQIPDERARRARIAEGEARYLSPALARLEESRGVHAKVESPMYLEGLIAFYARRYDDALARAQEALAASPWLSEPRRLEGDIWHAEARAEKQRGRYEDALRDYARATEAYRRAEEMARSDAANYEAESQVWLDMLEVAREQASPPRDLFGKAISACEKALAAAPESEHALARKSLAYWRLAQYQTSVGEDPSAALGVGIAAAEAAIRLDPEDAGILDTLGNIYSTRADHESSHGADPRASLDSAAESFRKATAARPLFAWPWNDLAFALSAKAQYEAEHGLDPRASFDQAIQGYDKATELEPSYLYPPSNKCDDLGQRAVYEASMGVDPRPILDRAAASCEAALAINPNYENAWINLATAFTIRGRYERDTGQDPRPSLDRAISLLTREGRGEHAGLAVQVVLGDVYQALAEYLVEQRADPTAALDRGRAAARTLKEAGPSDPRGHLLGGRLETLAARWAAQQDQDPAPLFARARALLDRVVALESRGTATWVALAELSRDEAAWALKHGGHGEAPLSSGLAAAASALAINPRMAQALALRGQLHLLAAQGARAHDERQASARRAAASFEEALRQNPALHRTLDALLDEARRLADADVEGSPPGPRGPRR